MMAKVKTNLPDKATVMSAVDVSNIAKTLVEESWIQDGQRVLSIASGIGLDEAYMVEKVKISLIGTDLDEDFLARARTLENNRLTFQKMDVTQPFGFPEPFTCVYARNLLHYFNAKDQRAVVERVCNALEPGGLFVFQLKSREDFFYTDPSVERHPLGDGMMYFPGLGFSRNHLSPEEVNTLMDEYGFDVRRMESHREVLYNDAHASTILTVIARKNRECGQVLI